MVSELTKQLSADWEREYTKSKEQGVALSIGQFLMSLAQALATSRCADALEERNNDRASTNDS